jgi:hypothetical protein
MVARSPMTILLLVLLASTTQAFAPSSIGQSSTSTTTTSLHMGLFDGMMKKPAKKDAGKEDVFGGRAAKITIRQDEDNAMWIEEPKPDKKKAPPPKKGK